MVCDWREKTSKWTLAAMLSASRLWCYQNNPDVCGWCGKSKQMTTDYYACCCRVFSVEEEWKRKGEARSRRDKSVMQCCWYVPFPDEDGASCDEENARRSGFSSLAWRTVQPAGNSSSSQWSDSSWNPLNGVAPPETILLFSLRVRLHLFLSFHGAAAPSHLQKKWSCSSLRVRLHLFLLFHDATVHSHL